MKEIIRRPVITEKATQLGELGQYVFEVDPKANKIEIKNAVQTVFEVDVVSVRTTRVKGKIKSRFTKKGIMRGKAPLRKKAYVTLKKGQTIDIVAGTAGQ